jgi:peptide/nickel transport system permease protein
MRTFIRFFSRPQNLVALVLVGFFIFVALFAERLAPEKDQIVEIKLRAPGDYSWVVPRPPSAQAPLGTIALSGGHEHHNVYTLLVWGTRSALVFGLTVATFTAIFGLLIGSISAYLGGFFNDLVMRITDAFLAFPLVVGVVLLQQLSQTITELEFAQALQWTSTIEQIGRPSPLMVWLAKLDPIMVALILFSWMPYARLTNSLVMQVKQMDFVTAARALGAGTGRVVLRHLLPNTISPGIVLYSRDIGGMILIQATLTFIGLGSSSVWGQMLADGRRWIIGQGGNFLLYWWVFLPATLAIIFFGIAWSLLGDGLNEALNPRSKMNYDRY